MSKRKLTKSQKMGSISYDELMNSLTEDLDQNYELMKRYILYNQLNGHKPFSFHNFIIPENEQKSILAVKTLLRYGMNPNIIAYTNFSIDKVNYVMALMLANFSDKTIYEAIEEGLKHGLNINYRCKEPTSLLETYCRTRSYSFYERNPMEINIARFYKFLIEHGFITLKKRSDVVRLLREETSTIDSVRYKDDDIKEFSRLLKSEIKKRDEKYQALSKKYYLCPVNSLGIKALKDNNDPDFTGWATTRMPDVIECFSDDFEDNYKIIKCIDEAQIFHDSIYVDRSTGVPIQNYLYLKNEKATLLGIKTFLKYGYHPNDCGIGERPTDLFLSWNGIGKASENFIFSIINAGFSEKFIIEVIKESIKYGFDVNTICKNMSLMHCLIFSKEYKGNISSVYRFLCENGFDSTLKNYEEPGSFFRVPSVNILKAIECAKAKGKKFDSADIKLFEEMYNEEILKVKKFLGIVKTEKKQTEKPVVDTKEKDSLDPTERTSEKELPPIGKDYYTLLSNLSKQELEILSLKLKYKDEISSQYIAKLLSIDEKVVNDVLNKIKNLYIDEKEQKPITRAKTRSFQEK